MQPMLSAFARDKVLHKTKDSKGRGERVYGGGPSYLLFELQEYLMARSSVGACLELKFYRLLSTSTPIFEPLVLRFACCTIVRFFTASRCFHFVYYFVGLWLILTALYSILLVSFIFYQFCTILVYLEL